MAKKVRNGKKCPIEEKNVRLDRKSPIDKNLNISKSEKSITIIIYIQLQICSKINALFIYCKMFFKWRVQSGYIIAFAMIHCYNLFILFQSVCCVLLFCPPQRLHFLLPDHCTGQHGSGLPLTHRNHIIQTSTSHQAHTTVLRSQSNTLTQKVSP